MTLATHTHSQLRHSDCTIVMRWYMQDLAVLCLDNLNVNSWMKIEYHERESCEAYKLLCKRTKKNWGKKHTPRMIEKKHIDVRLYHWIIRAKHWDLGHSAIALEIISIYFFPLQLHTFFLLLCTHQKRLNMTAFNRNRISIDSEL